MTAASSREEWAAGWPLPFAALVGVASSACFAYASGVLMVPMTAELHWTRAEFSSGFTAMMLAGLVFMPLAGRAADRFGSRRVALIGIVPYILWFMALALVGSSVMLWWLMCIGIAATTCALTPPVWISPVAAAFEKARGMALAIALSGIGLAMAVWPPLAALGIAAFGWREAIVGLALLAGLAMLAAATGLPKRTRGPSATQAAPVPPTPLGPALRSRTFICLALAGGLFSSVNFGLTLHFVPILTARGIDTTAAAGFAGLVGIASIVGRLGTGYLLDRIPTRVFGVIVFLLPIGAVALLSQGTPLSATAGAIVLGLAGGAEFDVVAYLAASRFPRSSFGAIYATITSVFAVCASTGPLLAGALFDLRGTYDLYLLAIVPIVIVAAALIALVPPPAKPAHPSEAMS